MEDPPVGNQSNPKEIRLPEFLKLSHRGRTPVPIDVPLDPPTHLSTGMTSE
ncbi:hypothetical protein H2248_008348 [Termitomyces sp. 'cryptogamus']|nr:hypothetical protein H2248_008348 [Termitomyces sp. 'cryptogamus']